MKPYYESGNITIYHGDCREILPALSADAVFADPPYGVGKAAWDDAFSMDWMPKAANAAGLMLAITPGIVNLLAIPASIGPQRYRWTLSVRIINATVRGALGFGNWIACLLYSRETSSIFSQLPDAGEIAIRGKMPDHPSPKPLDAMRWLMRRIKGESIIDPFCGSGTTLIVAKECGRRGIGIEIEEKYCEMAAKRLAQEVIPFCDVRNS